MKRIFAFLLMLLVLCSFAACGDEEQENEQSNAGNGGNDEIADLEDGLIFPGSDVEGGITLPEDKFE